MPLIQGGPPQWVWERTADPLKWEINTREDLEGRRGYELRINCGLEIVRLHFFAEDEIKELQSLIRHSPEWGPSLGNWGSLRLRVPRTHC